MIHNISIATANDVTYFGDDVKYIPCIFTQGNYHLGCCLNWLEKTIVSDHFLSICCKLIWELTNGH